MILNLKLLLSILVFISVVYSESSPFEYDGYDVDYDYYEEQNYIGDCLDIKNISKNINCFENDKGEVIKIEVKPESYNEKLLNYKTITNVTYTIDIDLYLDKSKEKIYKEFPESLFKFSNLKNLALNYYGDYGKEKYSIYQKLPIDKKYISSLPKTLEKLSLSFIDMKQYNIDEIASLSNLKALDLGNCNIKNLKFNSIENSDISTLDIHYIRNRFNSGDILEKNILKYFKSLKKLSMEGVEISQENVNEIGTLTNIEELNIELHSSLKLDPLENLNKLSVANIGYYERNMDDSEYEDDIEFVLNLKLPKNIRELYIDRKIKLSQSNLELISTFKNLEKLIINVESSLKYVSLKSLSKLTDLKIYNNYVPLNLKIPKSIKNLYLLYAKLSQENIDEISSANIEKLSLYGCSFANDIKFDSFKNLNLKKLSIISRLDENEDKNYGKLKEIPELLFSFKDLEELDIKEQEITFISNKIGNLKNLKILDLYGNYIENLPEEISKLENLEILDLLNNKIHAIIPESYNNLSNLTRIDLRKNIAIRGKTLTNESLKECYYDEKYYLCKAKDMDCFNEDVDFEKCSDNTNNSGRCGKDDGKCPNGQCCNKDGYCGTSESYCSLEKGCQNEYGLCNNECTEIEYYLRKKNIETSDMKCSTDSKGRVTQLNLYMVDLHEEDLKIILSYDTITSLIYDNDFIKDNDFVIKEISQLKNLKNLGLMCFDITQYNIDLISNLTNLEDLELLHVHFESNDISLKPLENLKKLKKLTIVGSMYEFIDHFPTNLPSLNSLKLDSVILNKEQLNEITSLTNLKELDLENYDQTELNLDKLKNLKNLEILSLNRLRNLSEFPESIFSLTHLKNLTLQNSEITSLPKELTKLTDLRYIDFQLNKLKEVPDFIGSLENLDTLDLYSNEISKVSEELNNCKNLEYLNLDYNPKIKGNFPNLEKLEKLKTLEIADNGLTKFPKWIGNLKNLEYLNLSSNKIEDEIPESYKLLPNLNYFLLYGNEKVTGKYLTNPSLKKCSYSIENSKLCKEPNVKIPCLENYYEKDELKICKSNTEKTAISTTTSTTSKTTIKEKSTTTITNTTTTTTTTTKQKINDKTTTTTTTTKTTTKTKTTDIPVGTNKEGKCGKDYGRCPSSECCSKYGYCGTSSKYCDISKGCQSEFGKCIKDEDKGKCGKGYGKCPSGECCSKYGYCGTSSDYCSKSKGCQSEFGKCSSSNKGKCGKDYGKCPSGECCSKYGYCGTSSAYCSKSKGCQSEFGKCN